jgi:hypothetical protein
MNANRLFVRDLLGMTALIVAITVLSLWLIPHDGEPVVTDVPAAYIR